MLHSPFAGTETNTKSPPNKVWFERRGNAFVSDSLLFYPDLLINVYDLLAVFLQLGGDFGQMPRTPRIHNIRQAVRNKSNHAIPIHFLIFCNLEVRGQGLGNRGNLVVKTVLKMIVLLLSQEV